MKKISLLIFCLIARFTQAQGDSAPLTIQGLDLFKADIASNPALTMSDITKSVSAVRIDLKYASKLNFTGKRMYPPNTMTSYLRSDVTKALAAISDELKKQDLGLLIWDAYRPYDVTVRFWELIHDERYVANPKKGSGHNRGIAVDLTLYRLSDGKELEMPTGCDDFSEKAHHGFMELGQEQINNRELLLNIMEKYGFKRFTTEWWHFSWPEAEKYAILNLSFKQLKQLQ
jgi:D-alanyl-D-alanine dipeptidase